MQRGIGEPASGERDEFEQAAVGVAEVHARSLAVRTLAAHRPELDLHAVGPQVIDRALDWSRPDEAEIASARLYRKSRNRLRQPDLHRATLLWGRLVLRARSECLIESASSHAKQHPARQWGRDVGPT